MPEEYEVSIRETALSDVLHDVSSKRSELGIVAFQKEQKALIGKSLYIHDLQFTETAKMDKYVFVRRQHPLAERKSLTLEDLKDYPFVTYDQDEAPSYYSEETVSFKPLNRNIHVCDRATKMAIIRNSNAFSIGIDLPNFNRDIYFRAKTTEMTAIPFFDDTGPVSIGFLNKIGRGISEIGRLYLELLTSHIEQMQLPGKD